MRPDSEHIDLDRSGLGRCDEDTTTLLDTRRVLGRRERAIAAHASQVSPFEGMPKDLRSAFLTTDRLMRGAAGLDRRPAGAVTVLSH